MASIKITLDLTMEEVQALSDLMKNCVELISETDVNQAPRTLITYCNSQELNLDVLGQLRDEIDRII